MNQTLSADAPQAGSAIQPLRKEEMEALKKSFADDGYFVVRNVVSPEKLSELHQEHRRRIRPGETDPARCFPAAAL